MKYIIKFAKRGRMAYISHLDTQHQFLRVLRMLGLRPTYSNGFNPHPKMSFALPLSLGFSSISEYLEFETETNVNTSTVIEKLNSVLPDGIEVLEFKEKTPEIKKTLASLVTEVRYEIISTIPTKIIDKVTFLSEDMQFKDSFERRDVLQRLRQDTILTDISTFVSRESIITIKHSRKKGIDEEFDIKPYIMHFDLKNIWGKQAMYDCVLSTKNSRSVNPLVLMEAFYSFEDALFNATESRIQRTAIKF